MVVVGVLLFYWCWEFSGARSSYGGEDDEQTTAVWGGRVMVWMFHGWMGGDYSLCGEDDEG
jgi:hypothetical protein